MTHASSDQAKNPYREAIADGLDPEALGERLKGQLGLQADPLAKWDPAWIVPADKLRDVVQTVRDAEDLAFDTLLEITGVDYLSFPNWRDERFAVVYLFKSTRFKHRLTLKVMVDEDEAELPSLHDCFPIADWLEREVWDQYGISFTDHPNLKRLLNHQDFVGHPLRKDYPVQKRQHLSVNDPMLDELTAKLEERGYRILDARLADPQGAG